MLAYDEFVPQVKEAVSKINQAAAEDENLLMYVCEEVADRISVYLNLPAENTKFDVRLVKIAARIASSIFTQTLTNVEGNGDDTEIKSISDNGQSITYGNKTKNYLATVADGELFGGFAELLKPYRRIHVVSR